jgi:hypothetical protein
MKRFLLSIALAVTVSAQIIPGRYIVEFNTPPAAALMTPQTRLLPGNEPRVAARRAQIAAERGDLGTARSRAGRDHHASLRHAD